MYGNTLPVPSDRVDQATLSNNLPGGNDRVPQINASQWLMANQQLGGYAIGAFRAMLQKNIQTTQLHCATYNLMAQGHFQNQLWQQWCQTLVDFLEFLIVVKRYDTNNAIEQAVKRLTEALLGQVFSNYPMLQQVTPTSLHPGLQTALQIYQSINNDIQQYRSGAYQNFNNGGGYNNNQLPQINTNGYNNNNFQTNGNYQTGMYQPNGRPQQYQPYNGQPSGPEPAGGSFYGEAQPTAPLRPVEEVSSDNFSNAYYPNPTPDQAPPMQTPIETQATVVEQTDLPVPTDVSQVVVDPTYYTPAGAKLDLERPYDVIHNPGGIIIRPAHQVTWEVTSGDDAPWLQLVDPNRFCAFLVKFPDGVVKEKFVEWKNSMDYLRHELDVELRRKAYRPNGLVVATTTPISTIGGDSATQHEIHEMVKDGHLKLNAVPPVIMTGAFEVGTDLEAEMQVREELQNILGTDFTTDTPMPECEYRSNIMHPLHITPECFAQLEMMATQEELGQIALTLRELTNQGILPIRYYRFINDRFTKAVNNVLRDSLTLTTDITDFAEDYPELEDYLQNKKGSKIVTCLRSACRAIVNKAFYLMVTNGDQYHVVDSYLNHQLGWTLDELTCLNITTGKPVMVSASAHPRIIETLRGMVGRANAEERLITGTLRVITSDGAYLEVIKGLLVEKAVLLKLIK